MPFFFTLKAFQIRSYYFLLHRHFNYFHTNWRGTYNENSSFTLLLYCFFGLIVWKWGKWMTSGQTAGMGVPQIRLETKKICMYAGNKVQTSMTQNDFEILAFPLELQINSFLPYLISSSWPISWTAGKIGFLVNNSPRMHLVNKKRVSFSITLLFSGFLDYPHFLLNSHFFMKINNNWTYFFCLKQKYFPSNHLMKCLECLNCKPEWASHLLQSDSS